MTWDYKYHIVFIPKFRRNILYCRLKFEIIPIFRVFIEMIWYYIIEGHICVDYVHICIIIPSKISVYTAVGYIKNKSAIYIARNYVGVERNYREVRKLLGQWILHVNSRP